MGYDPKTERNEEIIALYDEGRGVGPQELSERYNLTRTRIYQILERAKVFTPDRKHKHNETITTPCERPGRASVIALAKKYAHLNPR